MRCAGCHQYTSMFRHWTDTKIQQINYLCQSCYERHPCLIDYSVIPNDYHLVHLIHVISDGYFQNYVYNHIVVSVITWLLKQKYPIIYIYYEAIEFHMLDLLSQLNWTIIILNFEQKHKRSDAYDI